MSAHAEHELLCQARGMIAAVQAIGDRTVVYAIAFAMGVEQVERDAAYGQMPGAHPHFAAGEGHTDDQRLTRRSAHELRTERCKIIGIGQRLLAAEIVDGLAKIARLMRKAHSAERQV